MFDPETLSWAILAFPAIVACLFARNCLIFRHAPSHVALDCAVSVLIPARNEAAGIQSTLQALTKNRVRSLEIVVLDDHSTDKTANIVQQMSLNDDRIRYLKGQPLEEGWCGKQFACHQLASAASYDTLLFLDADVRVAADAIPRAAAQFDGRRAELLSGFPKQIVISFGEALWIPLIHVVLLCYLPIDLMRRTKMLGAAAGCGQFFITTKSAYARAGGTPPSEVRCTTASHYHERTAPPGS